MAQVEIKGFEEFQAKLRELDFSLQRKALIEVAKAGAKILVDEERSRAPRDSGDLADGIKMRTASRESNIHEATVTVGPDKKQFYARFVERGTKDRKFKRRHGSSGVMRATPFIEPALESSRERMAQAMKAKMLEIIRKIARSR